MGYLAGKTIKVGNETRHPGDPVPEAEFFRNLPRLIEWGRIVVGEYPEGFEPYSFDKNDFDPRFQQKLKEEQILARTFTEIVESSIEDEVLYEEEDSVAVLESSIEDEIADAETDEVSIEDLLNMKIDQITSLLSNEDKETIEFVLLTEVEGKNRTTLVKALEKMVNESD